MYVGRMYAERVLGLGCISGLKKKDRVPCPVTMPASAGLTCPNFGVSISGWMDGMINGLIRVSVYVRVYVCVYIYIYLHVCILTCPHVGVSSSPLCVRMKFTNQIRNMPYLISWPTFAGSTWSSA